MLSDRDYEWCAETMLKKFGVKAALRAELRARETLFDGNDSFHEIWIRVAAAIRKIQAARNAEQPQDS